MKTTVLVSDGQVLFAECLAISLALQPDLDTLQEYPTSDVETISACERLKPDVVLVDYWMPGSGGPPVAKNIISLLPKTKVMVMSGEVSVSYIQTALECGSVGFLPKSLSVDDVAGAVRRARAGENPVYGEKLRRLVAILTRRSESVDMLADKMASLTPRQLQVLGLLGAGLPIEDVAERLLITKGTVMVHISKILARTGASSHVEAVAMARRAGLIGPAPASQVSSQEAARSARHQDSALRHNDHE